MEFNKILEGDCVEVMHRLPENIADVIFADPPIIFSCQIHYIGLIAKRLQP